MARHAKQALRDGKTTVFVPTMGYLHEGHLSLVRQGKDHGDHHVVSIFVNPTQFGPNEDLDKYPRNMERDLALCKKAGVDVVFTPEAPSMYGKNYQTYVNLDKLPNHLCGLSRQVHFKGVATVVTKLFNIVRPQVAIFGEKDFQQLQVLRQMTLDLDFPIKILGGPIVRETDGLAMSSRNAYLKPDQRENATVLYQSLLEAKKAVAEGERNPETLAAAAREKILEKPETRIDYITLCDPETLEDVQTIDGPVLMAMAVFVGAPRLIDNMILTP